MLPLIAPSPPAQKLRSTLRNWFRSTGQEDGSDLPVVGPAQNADDASTPVDLNARLQSGAVTGIFFLLALYFLYFASPILIPIVMALLLSMLLAPFVRLLELVRVPRTVGAMIVLLIALGALFGIAAGVRNAAQSWLTDAPERFSRLEEKLRPIMAPFGKLQAAGEQLEKATASKDGPLIQKVEVTRSGLSGLLSSGTPHIASIAAVIGLLYLFLVSGDTFLRKLVTVIPILKDKKRAVEIVRNIEDDISYYLVLITVINVLIGLAVAAITAALGIANPILWGTLAAVLSFAPYVGEFVIVILLFVAGLLTFDTLAPAFVTPAIYFVLMTICWQVLVPIVVGRRMTLNPVAVFLMIMVLAWMWGSSARWSPFRCSPA